MTTAAGYSNRTPANKGGIAPSAPRHEVGGPFTYRVSHVGAPQGKPGGPAKFVSNTKVKAYSPKAAVLPFVGANMTADEKAARKSK